MRNNLAIVAGSSRKGGRSGEIESSMAAKACLTALKKLTNRS
jgi:hypothetical protein